MAKRIRAKLVLELLAKGMTGREIRTTRHISQRSIKLVRDAAERVGVTFDDVADMPDHEVYDLLFPAQAIAREAYAEPDWELVHSELQRDGVTLKLLWEEHCDEAARNGLVAKSYNTFCRGYKSYVASRGVTNHLEHKPGQVMEVDWNGTPMWLTDGATGEATKCHLFVATLPYSQYSYVEATLDMKQNTWLMCHVRAWDFFGGVAVRTVCDNLKCAAAHFMFNAEPRVMRSSRPLPQLAYRAEKMAAGWPEKKVLNKYAAYKVLIVDEHLIDKPTTDQMHFLLELTERRYDSSSTIFCSQYLWTSGTGAWAAAPTRSRSWTV